MSPVFPPVNIFPNIPLLRITPHLHHRYSPFHTTIARLESAAKKVNQLFRFKLYKFVFAIFRSACILRYIICFDEHCAWPRHISIKWYGTGRYSFVRVHLAVSLWTILVFLQEHHYSNITKHLGDILPTRSVPLQWKRAFRAQSLSSQMAYSDCIKDIFC